MDLNLAGKNVLVTGSTGLIGSELCRQLGACHANVILADSSPRNGELRDQLAGRYAQSVFLNAAMDVSREETAQALAGLVASDFGGVLHGLVNAVQYKSQSFFHDIKDTSLRELQDIFAANVYSIFWMMKHLTPAL